MTKRRPYKSPDGLDWRDPEMPVVRHYRMQNGALKTDIDPKYEHEYREYMVNNGPEKVWKKDPTYETKRRQRMK